MNLKALKENIEYISGILEHLEIEDRTVEVEFDIQVKSEDLRLVSKPITPLWIEYDAMKQGTKKIIFKMDFE